MIGSNPSREMAVTVRKRRRLAWLWLALVIMAIDDPCANNKSESLKKLPVYKGTFGPPSRRRGPSLGYQDEKGYNGALKDPTVKRETEGGF